MFRTTKIIIFLRLAVALQGAAATGVDRPAVDPGRIINESYGFLKDREPPMTESEMALYTKVIPMIETAPEMVFTLLGTMVADETPESPAFELALGNLNYASGRVVEAERLFKMAVEHAPEYLRAWMNLGMLYYGSERYADAARCFGRTVALGDREPRTLGVLGYSLYRSGSLFAAESAYLQALSIDSENTSWVSALASLYIEQGQPRRAEPLMRKLLWLHPEDGANWLRYALLLAVDDRMTEAVSILELATALNVADGEARNQLADWYFRQGREAEALTEYKAAETLFPGTATARLLAEAGRLTSLDRLDEAQAILTALTEPENGIERIRFLRITARLQAARENWVAARATLNEALRLSPQQGDLLMDLGQVGEASGDPTRAHLAYEAAAQQPGYAFRANLELANLAVRAREYGRSVAYLEAALAIEHSPALLQQLTRIRYYLSETRGTHNPSASP